MRLEICLYIRTQIKLINKINSIFNKIKDINFISIYNLYIDPLSSDEKIKLIENYNYIINDSILFLYFKIQIFNIFSYNNIPFFKIYKNGEDITNYFIILIALFCIPILCDANKKLINNKIFDLNCIHDACRSLKYKIKFLKHLNDSYGKNIYDCEFNDILSELSEHILHKRFSIKNVDCVKVIYKKNINLISNLYFLNIKNDDIIAELHLNDNTRFSIEDAIELLNVINKTFKKLYGIYPKIYIMSSWFFDEKIKTYFLDTFIGKLPEIFFEIPELSELSNSIFLHIYGCNKVLFSKTYNTKLTLFIEKNCNEIFYKNTYIVKVNNGKCIFKRKI